MGRAGSTEQSVMGFAESYPAGSATGMHSHARAHLVYGVMGLMQVDTETGTYLVPPTTAVFLPAGTAHSIRMEDRVELRALFFPDSAAERIGEKCLVVAVSNLLREVILAACKEDLDWALNGRGQNLAELALDELAGATQLPLQIPLPRDPRLSRVITALRAHPTDPRSMEDWADIAGASSRTLARLFQAETGLSFRQCRQQMRLVSAMTALSTGSSLVKASAIAGFASRPAFGVAFRSLYGLTPGEARRRYYSNRFPITNAFRPRRPAHRHKGL
jgi:AraC-like DNA-binding protein